MRDSLVKLCFTVLLILALAMNAAVAETVPGDLTERFSGTPKVEFEGKTYSLRNRLTVVLLMGILRDEEIGADVADFSALLVIDDAIKKVTPVRIDGNTRVELPDTAQMLPLRQVYALGADREESCQRMIQAVNGLLGGEYITAHLAFEVAGASTVEGYTPVEGNAEAQLRALKATLEQKSTDELNKLYAQMGDYIITDMKSGAAVKVLDKVERYEMPPSILMPVLEEAGAEEEPALRIPDTEAIAELIVGLFFEESKW